METNETHHRRHMPEPDLVPIMDALTSVIFFLLFSTTFMRLTQVPLPPSALAASKSNDETPLSPKLYLVLEKNNQLLLRLNWSGKNPGHSEATLVRTSFRESSTELMQKTKDLLIQFKEKLNYDQSLQVALDADANYQELITVMDGAREVFQDLVLMSPDEVKNRGAD